MSSKIYTAPPGTGVEVRGKTLPELLYDAAARYPNARALNQPVGGRWEPYATDAFRVHAEEAALGLLDLGLERGDRVALYLESDVSFCIADMGCLIAGLVDVPIYLAHGDEQIRFVFEHSEARALFVADAERLRELAPLLRHVSALETVILAAESKGEVPALPERIELLSMTELRARGRARLREDGEAVQRLLDRIAPGDLATLIYTSGTTGQPKGVMLTHENISFNAMTSIGSFAGYEPGADGEKVISFLPLMHIFARSLHYGFVGYGTSVYFTTPEALGEDLKKVRPTIFATVPRLIEKVYGRIQERTENLTGIQKVLGMWALRLAQQYKVGKEHSTLYEVQRRLADVLVYRKWREALGGNVKYIIVGGAALSEELANLFAAAGVPILQGYGLTESSPVISFNRPDRNRPGTVGEPIPGVEVKIADDGEILTRGPHVMKGYYKDEAHTAEVLTEDGWLHTGDVGEMTDEGFLKITDRKKDLFKLSTGKYVTPSPLENRLTASALIDHAVVLGSGRKFCAALLFLNEEALRSLARSSGLDAGQPLEQLVQEAAVVERCQALVDEANRGLDHWSTIKHFALLPHPLTVENALLTPTMKVRRAKVCEQFAEEIEALYRQAEDGRHRTDRGVAISS